MTHKPVFRLLAVFAMLFFLSSCASQNQTAPGERQQAAPAAEKVRYLTAVEDEPDTVDFQCTSIY